MTYKYDIKSNKKRFRMYALCAACVLGGAATFLFLPRLAAIVCTAAGLWVAGYIIKTIEKITRSRIITYTDGFTAYLPNDEMMEFRWDSITHAGLIVNGPHENMIFVYAEEPDKILRLPPMFCDFEAFKAEVQEHTPWKEYVLDDGETIVDRLKKLLAPQAEDSTVEEDSKE